MTVGTHPSVAARPPNLPVSVETITGRPSIQDEDDSKYLEAENDPEGDLANGVTANEVDAAHDPTYDNDGGFGMSDAQLCTHREGQDLWMLYRSN
jgi:hypothetical protein